MSYADFRASINSLDYVDDIYVEIRNLGSGDVVVGFFDINDTATAPAQIPQNRATAWPSSALRFRVLGHLASAHPAFLVFCDAGMKEFHIHHHPFNGTNYQCLNELAYMNFLQGLSGAAMSNNQVRGPKYPALLPPYSVWHYKLNWACKCRDIDYFEIRDGVIRAILEITGKLKDESHLKNSLEQIFARWRLHQSMFRSITNGINAPAFFVVHTIPLDVFYVFDINFLQVLSGDQVAYIGLTQTHHIFHIMKKYDCSKS